MFYTRPGQVLTVFLKHLNRLENGNGKAKIEIYDGIGSGDNLLAAVDILNNTRPQAVTTTGHNLYINVIADAKIEVFATIRIVSSFRKYSTFDVDWCIDLFWPTCAARCINVLVDMNLVNVIPRYQGHVYLLLIFCYNVGRISSQKVSYKYVCKDVHQEPEYLVWMSATMSPKKQKCLVNGNLLKGKFFVDIFGDIHQNSRYLRNLY